jgi:hypothetical protein
MMPVIAVDWSGAAYGGRSHVWLAEALQPGQLARLERSTRENIADMLLHTQFASSSIVGLDFAFAFPEWFATHIGVGTAPDLWEHVANRGEEWLADCAPPFWGRRGCPRTIDVACAFRRTEVAVPSTSGIRPKSVFQIGGAGSVGTGSIRGMSLLHRLHEAGASIWPFTHGGAPTVVEIYPRLLTGPVRKSNASARAEYLDGLYPDLTPEDVSLAVQSEDAFDAGISALVMIEHAADLASLPAETDPTLRLEGRIWHPNWRAERVLSSV